MENDNKLTKRQLENDLKAYRKIFSVVRVLHEKDIAVFADRSKTAKSNCFDFWKRNCSCENCISSIAFREKKQKAKLEFCDNEIYQVIARYVEVDGEPCVVELIKKFCDESEIYLGDGKFFSAKLEEYFQKTYTDVLTGTLNRRYYEEKLSNFQNNGGVAMIDIDDFKIYNDIFGHSAGDRVLEEVVGEIKRHIRKTDRLVRYGGDEFLIFMPSISRERFAKRIADIRDGVNGLTFNGNDSIKPSLSIGAVMISGEKVSAGVKKADEFLYLAKREKNVIVTDFSNSELRVSRPKILIVDDADINREILSSILQNEYDIIEASDGESCKRKIEENLGDLSLVLLDLIMPGTNGFDVLEYMNRN